LTERFGWRSAFMVPGLISIVIGCAYAWQSARIKADASATHASPSEHFVANNRARQIRVFMIVLVAALFGGAVFNTVTVSLPKLFDERLLYAGVNLTQIGGYAALVFAVAAFAQLPVGDLLDRFGARSILIGLLVPQIGVLILIANTQGVIVIPIAMALVLLLFAEIPITSWLLGHYVAPHWRARAFSLEYVLSLGMGAVIVPLIAWGHRMGHGFDTQYLVLAISAGMVLIAACFLPAWSNKAARALPESDINIKRDPEVSRT
jgi:MFS family permease